MTTPRQPWRRLLAFPARCIDAALLAVGLLVYGVSGRTPHLSYHAMRRLYGPTNGLLNKAALALARRLHPPKGPGGVGGFLGGFSASDIEGIVARLDAEGYAILDRRLPAETCDALMSLALTTPCRPMGARGDVLYSEADAVALRYDFAEQDILANPVAARLAFDGTFAGIAEAYFRCRPIYDFAAMWWTTRFGAKDFSKAAQEFHFDMDRLNFLKFFVYLTDVDPQSGPHVFVAGSHKYKPRSLRDPTRYDDGEVGSGYPPGAVRSICGERGTIFIADTSGIHKGMPVVSGHRLVFQVEFATGLFGQSYPRPKVRAAALAEAGIPIPLDDQVYGNVDIIE